MKRLALTGLLFAVVLAGCGGLKKGGLTPVGNEEATEPPAKARSSATVSMVSISYQPKTVRVRPGAKVTWVNRDKVAHTVTVGDELYNSLNSGPLEPGKRYTHVFHKKAKIGYRCILHPNMEGTVFVQAN
jgi:plastocyanin